MYTPLLAAALVFWFLMWCLFKLRKLIFASWLFTVVWRWHSGEAYHGKPMTDAGWFRPGTRAMTPVGHAHRWWHRPRWQRAAHRTGASLFVLTVLWGAFTAPAWTIGVFAGAVLLGVAFLTWRLVAWLLAREHRRTWLLPLHLAAHDLVGLPRAERAANWITYDLEAKRVVMALPQGWPADAKDKDRLVAIATSKLGIENPSVTWRLAGPKPQLMIVQSAPVPGLVRFGDVREAVDAALPGQVVLGLGQGSRPVVLSQRTDSPHWGISAESGSGKSVTARAIIAQHLHRGGIVAIIDAPKRFSHQWCKGLPNVAYARTPEECASLLHWLREESDRRNEVSEHAADLEGNVSVPFDHILFVVEEANALMKRLRDLWRQDGGTGTPQAIGDLGELVLVGRQVRYNGLFVGQRMSAKASGDGDIRENLGVLILLNPSLSAWKMLAPRFPAPPPDNTRGRAQVVSDKVQECQGVWMTAVEAREYAMSGRVTVCPPDMRRGLVSSPSPALPGGPDLRVVLETPPVVLAPAGEVTLSEAVAQGIVSLKIHALRKAAQRDENFPRRKGLRGTAGVWDALELSDWNEARS